MSNISAPRGLKPPTLQTAGKQDGGGNGSGGMYFGQEYQEPYAEDVFSYAAGGAETSTGDMPYSFPLLNSISVLLTSWKTALANALYQGIRKQ